MSPEFVVLAGTSATIGLVHTIFGPDHYLPFIVLSKARQWSSVKTLMITFLCGIGHVLSSVVLGFIGIAVGITVFKLEAVESFRGELAAWLLIIFGFTYFVWGIHQAIRNRPHKHFHIHENGDEHLHPHKHIGDHSHIHISKFGSLTPWILFIIFVFGPCEPLIPLVMYPAAKGNMITVVMVTAIFGLTTVGTMLGIVLGSFYGLSMLQLRKLERYSHALAGLIIFLCGGATKFLGL
ncbi:MAG: sulfite exporter TauE/SafE family protein [Elusimicrobiota bacterium]|nr:sulfite exporter TauE/SafE family protein [Elusimicrobiota bacterium]